MQSVVSILKAQVQHLCSYNPVIIKVRWPCLDGSKHGKSASMCSKVRPLFAAMLIFWFSTESLLKVAMRLIIYTFKAQWNLNKRVGRRINPSTFATKGGKLAAVTKPFFVPVFKHVYFFIFGKPTLGFAAFTTFKVAAWVLLRSAVSRRLFPLVFHLCAKLSFTAAGSSFIFTVTIWQHFGSFESKISS